MNQLEQKGKARTLQVCASLLILSAATIYYYQMLMPQYDPGKLGSQIIRFLLTAGLLYAVYTGKNWARTIALILFSIAVLGALAGIIFVPTPIEGKIPLMVMLVIYSVAIYHFGFSKSFKAFFEFQNGRGGAPDEN